MWVQRERKDVEQVGRRIREDKRTDNMREKKKLREKESGRSTQNRRGNSF